MGEGTAIVSYPDSILDDGTLGSDTIIPGTDDLGALGLVKAGLDALGLGKDNLHVFCLGKAGLGALGFGRDGVGNDSLPLFANTGILVAPDEVEIIGLGLNVGFIFADSATSVPLQLVGAG